MAVGDAVYIHKTTGELSDSPTDGLLFGYILSAITGTGSPLVRPIWVIGATRDLAATASDLSVTGDLYVGDDTDITGDLRVDATIGTSSTLSVTGAITGGSTAVFDSAMRSVDGYFTDDLIVESDLTVDGVLYTTGVIMVAD